MVSRVLLGLLAGVSPAWAVDIELSTSRLRLDGVATGGRAGTVIVDALGAYGGGSVAIGVGAYLVDNGSDAGAGALYLISGTSATGSQSLSASTTDVIGDQALARVGFAASARGDWNGDGVLDVAVGGWSVDGASFDTGAVYVFFGGPGLSGSFETSDADVVLTGINELDHFGWSLDMRNDVNGDGEVDLVVGAPLAEGADISTGAVYVFFGGPSRTSGTSLNAAAADVTMLGVEVDQGAGSAVATGEMNGSGPADIAIGAPNRNIVGRFNAGAVYLVRGTGFVSGTTIFLDTDADRVIRGSNNNDAFGTALAVAKVNDDADDDLLVGAPLATAFRGKAYIFDSPAIPGNDIESNNAATVLNGDGGGDLFGASLAVVGDLDGDGFLETVIGAPGVNRPGRASCGAAFVYLGDGGFPSSGNAATAERTYVGTSSGDEAGAAVGGTSDFTLDGRPDLVVGAPGRGSDTGAVYVISGAGVVSVGATDAAVSLRAPHPNPFRSLVRVVLDVADARRTVVVDVYDAAGRAVASEVAPVTDGVAAMAWDARDRAPGVYFVRARGFAAAQRVTLLR